LTALPSLELPEECVFLLLAHRPTTGSIPALVDEAREHDSQILRALLTCHLHIPLQPLFRGGIATPTWNFGGNVYFLPLWVVASTEQRLEIGEKSADKAGEVSLAFCHEPQIGSSQNAADR